MADAHAPTIDQQAIPNQDGGHPLVTQLEQSVAEKVAQLEAYAGQNLYNGSPRTVQRRQLEVDRIRKDLELQLQTLQGYSQTINEKRAAVGLPPLADATDYTDGALRSAAKQAHERLSIYVSSPERAAKHFEAQLEALKKPLQEEFDPEIFQRPGAAGGPPTEEELQSRIRSEQARVLGLRKQREKAIQTQAKTVLAIQPVLSFKSAVVKNVDLNSRKALKKERKTSDEQISNSFRNPAPYAKRGEEIIADLEMVVEQPLELDRMLTALEAQPFLVIPGDQLEVVRDDLRELAEGLLDLDRILGPAVAAGQPPGRREQILRLLELPRRGADTPTDTLTLDERIPQLANNPQQLVLLLDAAKCVMYVTPEGDLEGPAGNAQVVIDAIYEQVGVPFLNMTNPTEYYAGLPLPQRRLLYGILDEMKIAGVRDDRIDGALQIIVEIEQGTGTHRVPPDFEPNPLYRRPLTSDLEVQNFNRQEARYRGLRVQAQENQRYGEYERILAGDDTLMAEMLLDDDVIPHLEEVRRLARERAGVAELHANEVLGVVAAHVNIRNEEVIGRIENPLATVPPIPLIGEQGDIDHALGIIGDRVNGHFQQAGEAQRDVAMLGETPTGAANRLGAERDVIEAHIQYLYEQYVGEGEGDVPEDVIDLLVRAQEQVARIDQAQEYLYLQAYLINGGQTIQNAHGDVAMNDTVFAENVAGLRGLAAAGEPRLAIPGEETPSPTPTPHPGYRPPLLGAIDERVEQINRGRIEAVLEAEVRTARGIVAEDHPVVPHLILETGEDVRRAYIVVGQEARTLMAEADRLTGTADREEITGRLADAARVEMNLARLQLLARQVQNQQGLVAADDELVARIDTLTAGLNDRLQIMRQRGLIIGENARAEELIPVITDLEERLDQLGQFNIQNMQFYTITPDQLEIVHNELDIAERTTQTLGRRVITTEHQEVYEAAEALLPQRRRQLENIEAQARMNEEYLEQQQLFRQRENGQRVTDEDYGFMGTLRQGAQNRAGAALGNIRRLQEQRDIQEQAGADIAAIDREIRQWQDIERQAQTVVDDVTRDIRRENVARLEEDPNATLLGVQTEVVDAQAARRAAQDIERMRENRFRVDMDRAAALMNTARRLTPEENAELYEIRANLGARITQPNPAGDTPEEAAIRRQVEMLDVREELGRVQAERPLLGRHIREVELRVGLGAGPLDDEIAGGEGLMIVPADEGIRMMNEDLAILERHVEDIRRVLPTHPEVLAFDQLRERRNAIVAQANENQRFFDLRDRVIDGTRPIMTTQVEDLRNRARERGEDDVIEQVNARVLNLNQQLGLAGRPLIGTGDDIRVFYQGVREDIRVRGMGLDITPQDAHMRQITAARQALENAGGNFQADLVMLRSLEEQARDNQDYFQLRTVLIQGDPQQVIQYANRLRYLAEHRRANGIIDPRIRADAEETLAKIDQIIEEHNQQVITGEVRGLRRYIPRFFRGRGLGLNPRGDLIGTRAQRTEAEQTLQTNVVQAVNRIEQPQNVALVELDRNIEELRQLRVGARRINDQTGVEFINNRLEILLQARDRRTREG